MVPGNGLSAYAGLLVQEIRRLIPTSLPALNSYSKSLDELLRTGKKTQK